MKSFFKTVLAVICGILILHIIGLIFLFSLVGAAGSTKTVLPRNGVLDISLADYTLAEQTQDSPIPDVASLNFEMNRIVGLWDAVQAIQAAAADPAIQYILLRPDGGTAGMAALEELRSALVNFRKSGKAVVAFLEAPGNGGYYLATAADKIYLSSYHGATYQMFGLTSQQFFLKDILEKLGVNVQLIRHGKYKSAGEMFIRSGSSAENREQYQAMVDASWKTFSSAVAQERGISEEQFNDIIDNLRLVLPEDFLKYGLVDELMDRETLVNKLCTLAQVNGRENLHLVALPDYVQARLNALPGRANVAVLFAEGDIVEGKGPNLSADSFVQVIDALRKDNSVKAVVLRVNSPGGSVMASEKIRRELDLLGSEKPLVASYGDYAASGGYWISCGCSRIFADATTLTGSIGVFSMIPDFSKVAGKIGVGVESISSNKHGDLLSLMRPFDAQETAYMQASVEDIYERFVNLVASSRGMEPARVDEIAQGRVWTGSDALEIGLVDELGTLKDAIVYAASQAGLLYEEDYKVISCPAVPTPLEQAMLLLGPMQEEPTILADTPFEPMARSLDGLLKDNQPTGVYARLPYYLEIK